MYRCNYFDKYDEQNTTCTISIKRILLDRFIIGLIERKHFVTFLVSVQDYTNDIVNKL